MPEMNLSEWTTIPFKCSGNDIHCGLNEMFLELTLINKLLFQVAYVSNVTSNNFLSI